MVGYIYRITNICTGQHYIGQTIDINRRKRKHFNTLVNNQHDNPKLQASWNKYGKDNFEFESWEFNITSLEELDNDKKIYASIIDLNDSSLAGEIQQETNIGGRKRIPWHGLWRQQGSGV